MAMYRTRCPEGRHLRIRHSMWAAQAVATVARLGIPDQLAHGPCSASELANVVGASPSALYRLLRVCCCRCASCRRSRALQPDAAGECLRSDVNESMRSLVIAEMRQIIGIRGEPRGPRAQDKPSFKSALSMPLWDRKSFQEQHYFAEL